MPLVVPRSTSPVRRSGFTLIEILVTAVLSLIILGAVVSLFGTMGRGVNDARASLEMTDRLRAVEAKLKDDLANLTITSGGGTLTANPPTDATAPLGYFEYTEGPIGPVLVPSSVNDPNYVAQDTDNGRVDTTVGDIDDTLQFTRRMNVNTQEPFVGRVLMKRWPRPGETPDPASPDGTGEFCLIRAASSEAAEVAWFLRGTTLYRRVLLVLPEFDADLRTTTTPAEMQLDSSSPTYATMTTPGPGFYNDYDVAVCRERRSASPGTLVPAVLGESFRLRDLATPENRFAHRPLLAGAAAFPPTPITHPRRMVSWGATSGSELFVPPLGLPTLVEGSSASWTAAAALPSSNSTYASVPSVGAFDAWRHPYPWNDVNSRSGTLAAYQGPRLAEDIVLTNVLSFDVKVWDPGAPLMLTASNTVLLPSDPGYNAAIGQYAPNPQTSTSIPRPVGYGAFVDLNYMVRQSPSLWTWTDALRPVATPTPVFNGPGNVSSGLRGNVPFVPPADPRAAAASVFDTWTTTYDIESTPGACPPPYAERVQAIQVKIRVFDPGSRQIREVTVIQRY